MFVYFQLIVYFLQKSLLEAFNTKTAQGKDVKNENLESNRNFTLSPDLLSAAGHRENFSSCFGPYGSNMMNIQPKFAAAAWAHLIKGLMALMPSHEMNIPVGQPAMIT